MLIENSNRSSSEHLSESRLDNNRDLKIEKFCHFVPSGGVQYPSEDFYRFFHVSIFHFVYTLGEGYYGTEENGTNIQKMIK